MPEAEASIRDPAAVASRYMHGSMHPDQCRLRQTGPGDHHAPNPAPVDTAHLAAPFHGGGSCRHPQPGFGDAASRIDIAQRKAGGDEDLVNGHRPTGRPAIKQPGLEGFDGREQHASGHPQSPFARPVSAECPSPRQSGRCPATFDEPRLSKERQKYLLSHKAKYTRFSTSEFVQNLTESSISTF